MYLFVRVIQRQNKYLESWSLELEYMNLQTGYHVYRGVNGFRFQVLCHPILAVPCPRVVYSVSPTIYSNEWAAAINIHIHINTWPRHLFTLYDNMMHFAYLHKNITGLYVPETVLDFEFAAIMERLCYKSSKPLVSVVVPKQQHLSSVYEWPFTRFGAQKKKPYRKCVQTEKIKGSE